MCVQFSEIVLKDEVNEYGQQVNMYGGKIHKMGPFIGSLLGIASSGIV